MLLVVIGLSFNVPDGVGQVRLLPQVLPTAEMGTAQLSSTHA
jgi:hypothetical protein